MQTNYIYQGDSLEVLKTLPSESVNMIITSPPYYALRDYGVKGQLGLEKTFQGYIEKLISIFDEAKRVLRKDGTCWVNISDTYSGSNNGSNDYRSLNKTSRKTFELKYKGQKAGKTTVPSKSLLGIPFRFALAMMDRGWILRNTLIWHKPNCMPSSVKDRFTIDFEYLFFFVKSKRYWFEQQFEKLQSNDYDIERMKNGRREYKGKWSGNKQAENYGSPRARTQRQSWNNKSIQSAFVAGGKKGRNKRCVWKIPTKPFKESHFAVYPEKLIETPIQAGCPKGGTVLDMFMGSGTTGVVAKKLGRNYVGIELNSKYIAIANKRLLKVQRPML